MAKSIQAFWLLGTSMLHQSIRPCLDITMQIEIAISVLRMGMNPVLDLDLNRSLGLSLGDLRLNWNLRQTAMKRVEMSDLESTLVLYLRLGTRAQGRIVDDVAVNKPHRHNQHSQIQIVVLVAGHQEQIVWRLGAPRGRKLA